MTYILVVAVVLVLMNTYFLTASRNMVFTSKQASVQHRASAIAAGLEDSFDTLTADYVSKVMDQLDTAGVTNIVVADADGSSLYGSVSDGDAAVSYDDNIKRALEGFDIFYARFYEGTFSSNAFTPVMGESGVIGAVYVNDEDSEIGEILVDMQSTLKNISIIIVVFSVAMIAFIIWSVMRRITSILKAIKTVREGEYNYRVTMRGWDELAILGDEFNRLTDRLRETDEIRRRFVANASHELKTPLASIRLLSDSILQNQDIERETVKEFISDIGAEAERLSRTTEKLMTLNRLDSHISAESGVVDVKEAVVATIRMLKPLAQNRNLSLDSELQDNCLIVATDDSVHQIVFNLVENAIKYNKPDGSVSVRLEAEDEFVVLTVDDRGVGVPDEDLPYIFDRFYRVDKARSREAGGSGLGLSIVWDTVRDLGGKVNASPRDGGGMSFKVRFSRTLKG